MAVNDHGLEVLKKAGNERTAGDKSDYYLAVTVIDTWARPTSITLSNSIVDDGDGTGTIVGLITIVDSSSAAHTITITTDADDKFDIGTAPCGTTALILDNTVDYSTSTTHEVTIRATNEYDLFKEETFVICVSPPNSDSIEMNGIDEYLSAGNKFNYDIANAFSVCMWVKPNNIAAAHILFSKATLDASVNGYMLRADATTGALFLQMRSTVNRSHTFDTALTAGSWQFICFTYSGAADISGASVYRNAIKNTTSPSGSLTGTMLFGQPFYIGQRNDSFGFYPGLIDEITIWDKELNQTEITELYNGGSVYDYSGHSAVSNLVSWYRFDNDTIPAIVDHYGSNDMTSYNMDSSNLSSDTP